MYVEITSAVLLEIVTAVAQLEAGVIAVARLVVQILDDRVERRLLHDARRVASVAAQRCLATRAGQRRLRRPRDEAHDGEGNGRTFPAEAMPVT